MKVRCDNCHKIATVKETNFPWLIDENGEGWQMIPPNSNAPRSILPEPLPQDNEEDARIVKSYFFICDPCSFKGAAGNYVERFKIMP